MRANKIQTIYETITWDDFTWRVMQIKKKTRIPEEHHHIVVARMMVNHKRCLRKSNERRRRS